MPPTLWALISWVWLVKYHQRHQESPMWVEEIKRPQYKCQYRNRCPYAHVSPIPRASAEKNQNDLPLYMGAWRVKRISLTPRYRILSSPNCGWGQSVPSAVLLRVSKARRRRVAGQNFEFSVAEPKKQVPIIRNFWAAETAQYLDQFNHFLKNSVCIMGGMLYIMAFGPGRYSMDRDDA